MAIRTPEELRTSLTAILGETPNDDGLTLLEDLADTMSSLTSAGSAADWKRRYDENDKAWRKRYTERFNAPVDDNNDDKQDDKKDDKPMTFESLFKEE